MSEAAWFAIGIVLLLAFLYWRESKPDRAERMDDWGCGSLITVIFIISGLAAVYGVVRFVHWAWYH